MSDTLAFEIHDMTCGHCAATITKVVKGIDGGAKVDVDLTSHRVTIESGRAGSGDFSRAIREAGYTPVPIERRPAD
jgi:copper chaperone